MRKSVLALLLGTVMVMSLFTGCGREEEVVEEAVEEVVESEEEFSTEYFYSIQTYGPDEALLVITNDDGNGGTYEEESGSYGWFGSAGGTFGSICEEWGVLSIEPTCGDLEFLGWKGFVSTVTVDADGMEFYEETEFNDGQLYTTEEMLALELPESDLTFYTIWALECGGCEELKECSVYYIDDDVYYVCDDCYEEFATGMGLE